MRVLIPNISILSLTKLIILLGAIQRTYSFLTVGKLSTWKLEGQQIACRRNRIMALAGPNNDGETVGQMYGGLVFLKTKDRLALVEFYKSRIGMVGWLEQPNITILKHGNMILGFHQPQQDEITPDLSGMYTFVYPSREQVDAMHSKLKDIADRPPRVNPVYKIYQFFAKDPEGRDLEFQAFLHPLSIATSEP